MSNANNNVDPIKPPLLKPPGKEATPEQKEALGKLGNLFKGRVAQYQPILKSLEMIGIEQQIMTVMIADVPVECIIIPLQELIFREWRQLSGSTLQPQREETESE
jgi:hypothetical protein